MNATKRHNTDALLADLVEELENDEGRHLSAFRRLLRSGPLLLALTGGAEEQLKQWPADAVAQFRGECLVFLRSLVRGTGTVASTPLSTQRPFTFYGLAAGGRAGIHAKGEIRDLLVLQLTALLQIAGVHLLRLCPAHGCNRIFVKRHKKEYCARACQNRVAMKKKREKEREEQQAWEAANRRQKGRQPWAN